MATAGRAGGERTGPSWWSSCTTTATAAERAFEGSDLDREPLSSRTSWPSSCRGGKVVAAVGRRTSLRTAASPFPIADSVEACLGVQTGGWLCSLCCDETWLLSGVAVFFDVPLEDEEGGLGMRRPVTWRHRQGRTACSTASWRKACCCTRREESRSSPSDLTLAMSTFACATASSWLSFWVSLRSLVRMWRGSSSGSCLSLFDWGSKGLRETRRVIALTNPISPATSRRASIPRWPRKKVRHITYPKKRDTIMKMQKFLIA
mmetsp:Transcript_49723/g.97982  ORF Transcript_49723/g.97982 Transcript_49723/m.97982 type:complete len:262 (-) Transcript_49723:1631-2416(-)